MFVRTLVSGVAVVLAAAPAAAQLPKKQLDRFGRGDPEVVVEAGGRVGTCDALLFSGDGKFLFAGGDDKVVRVWPHGPAGLVTAAADDPTDETKARTMRWRAWREQRGGIKTVALSPDARTIAVGGYGMKPATISLIDRTTGAVVAQTWPKSRENVDNFYAVFEAAVHPDGRRVAFATADGSVWLWDPKKLDKPDADGRGWNAPVRVGRHAPRNNGTDLNFVKLLDFPDAATVVSVAESGEVATFGLDGNLSDDPAVDPPKARQAFGASAGLSNQWRVFDAARTADGRALVLGCYGEMVLVKPVDGGKATEIALPKGTTSRGVAVHPKTGQVAVVVGRERTVEKGQPRFGLSRDDVIWLFPGPRADAKPVEIAHRGPADALAFHPELPRLAVAGGDADEVKLLDLEKPAEPLTIVRGAGRRPWGVNIAEGGNVIGVQTARDPEAFLPNARGAGAWTAFDLGRWRKLNDPALKWVGPRAEADGWAVEPDPDSMYKWWLVSRDGAAPARHALEFDPDREQEPTCYTLVPAARGKPTRLLVGTLYGVSLYEVRKEGVKRTKVYTGHAGKVHSVVAAADGRWFVTGGADHTVAAYSLEDWDFQPILGAAAEVQGNHAVITDLDLGSPAWEAGLSKGAVIEYLAVNGRRVFDRRPTYSPVGMPADVVAALKNAESRKELYFGIAPTPQLDRWETGTTVRQRPLWKWFPAFDADGAMTDWVIWMWKGSYYYTDSTHGDRLVGWHVNAPDVDGQPRFYQLNQFQKRYHNQKILKRLVTSKRVADALEDINKLPEPEETFGRREPAPIDFALDRTALTAGGDLTATVSVRPRGNNPDRLPVRAELWLNDYRVKAWEKADAPALVPNQTFATRVTLPAAAFRTKQENKLTLLTYTNDGGRAERTAMPVRLDDPARVPDLHTLAVGIDDYSGSVVPALALGNRKGFGDLRSAVKDAEGVAESLNGYLGKGRVYPTSQKVVPRLNAKARRDDILNELGRLRKPGAVKPDDVLIVFFAGHGDLPGTRAAKPAGGGRGGPADAGPFVFCCPDYAEGNVAGTSVSAEELFDALAAVNCRKVVLLDACHSGGAVEANVLRHCCPEGQGPVVFAACDQSESSFEDPAIGHGLFTFAVLEALGPRFAAADANRNGAITAAELFAYVKPRVQQLARDVRKGGDTQTPIPFPRTLPALDLVAVPPAPAGR